MWSCILSTTHQCAAVSLRSNWERARVRRISIRRPPAPAAARNKRTGEFLPYKRTRERGYPNSGYPHHHHHHHHRRLTTREPMLPPNNAVTIVTGHLAVIELRVLSSAPAFQLLLHCLQKPDKCVRDGGEEHWAGP